MTAPWRDPRYAPDTVVWKPSEDGGGVLVNPAPVGRVFPTAAAPLDHWAARDGARLWLAERSGAGWRRLSYAEAAARVAALAGGLARLGLAPGRPLMLLARNGIDTALVTYAAMRAGIAVAPVTPQYGLPGAEPSRLRHALAVLDPAAVYVDDPAAYADALAAASLPCTLVLDPADLARLAAGPTAPDLGDAAAIAKLLLTSGSTGAPKAVALSHANLAVNAAQVAACYDDPDPPVMVNSAPWSHSLGAHAILHMAAHRGGTLYVDAGQPTAARFAETLRNLAEVETTYLNMVPAGWALLADALERDASAGEGALGRTVFARLRVMQYGGAGLPADVLRRVGEAAVAACGERVTFAAGYGVTETTPTVSNVRWPNARSGLLGAPIPGTELKLAPVGGGKLEVRVRGPQVALGYRGADGGVAPLPVDGEGFYATGDAGRLAEPQQPGRGIVFDGRLVENFKLTTGAFVAASAVRLAALSALGGLATDAVVCGEGQAGVGLLLFPNAQACAALATGGARDATVREAVRARLAALNAASAAAGGRVARALVLDGAPDAASGELTDKGYLNQALARARRPAELARLFAAVPDADVIVL